jgi:hypothetical protein
MIDQVQMTTSRLQIVLQEIYMMIDIKKSLMCRFQKSITFLFEKMSPKKGTAASLFHDVFVVRHAISRRNCRPSCYFTYDEVASSLRLSGTQ